MPSGRFSTSLQRSYSQAFLASLRFSRTVSRETCSRLSIIQALGAVSMQHFLPAAFDLIERGSSKPLAHPPQAPGASGLILILVSSCSSAALSLSALGLFSGASTLKASRSSCTRVFRRSRDRAESLYASADSPRRASLPCDELLQSPRLSAASIDLLDDLALGAHLSARIIALPKLIEDVESALWLMRLGSNTVGHGKTG